MEIDKNKLDVAQIFETYIAFGGDEDKCSVALNIDTQTIHALAIDEGWKKKISLWDSLAEGDKKTVQIAVNRGVSFVQAHRLRILLDKVIGVLSQGTPEDLIERLTIAGKNGPEFRTRALTDLVKAAESVQLMAARSLGDTADERPEGMVTKESTIALAVIRAMNATCNSADEAGANTVKLVKELDQK